MVPIHFKAEWDDKRQQMMVLLSWQPEAHFSTVNRRTLDSKSHVEDHIEWFDRAQWADYIANLDNRPLRLGGLVLDVSGKPEAFESAVKSYLRKVNEVFEKTGQTI